MQRLLLAVFLSVCYYSSSSNAETQVTNPGHSTVRDDSFVEVPLQFVFPFFGEEFSTSYMFTNGVVGFQDPTQRGVQSHWCCQGRDLEALAEAGVDISQYSFVIAPLWTDLIDLRVDADGDGQVDSGLFTDGDSTQMTYIWRNLAEYRNATKLNTFELQIKPDGTYDIDYTGIDIINHAITSGVAGDLTGAHLLADPSTAEGFTQYFYSSGFTGVLNGYNNNLEILCVTNPLYDPQCPGYAAAYAQYLFEQQCSANPLYDSTCSGYANAYYEQQCTLNPLYDSGCSGYTQAFYNQQCSLDPLYDSGCPGYAQAYLDQQCSLDPLYDTSCYGYAQAYLDQQCSLDPLYDISCPGYDTAYFNQQCTLDATYNPQCPDYYMAMCEEDPLYDMGCIGYDTANFEYQCSLDSQYDQNCVGYVNLSNDGDFIEIFDPVIEDILEEEYNENNYITEQTVPSFVTEFFEEAFDVDIIYSERDTFEEALELDLESELSELDENSFEREVLEEEPELTEDVEDPRGDQIPENDDITGESDAAETNDGQAKTEDDIENEITSLEKTADSEGKSEQMEKPETKVQESSSDVRPDADSSRRNKLKMLIAAKANQATKELEEAVTLEQQMNIQKRILALISFVPDFKDEYTEKEVTQVNFYPPKPVVDHAYARWFLNDPTFGAMEDLQYPSLR